MGREDEKPSTEGRPQARDTPTERGHEMAMVFKGNLRAKADQIPFERGQRALTCSCSISTPFDAGWQSAISMQDMHCPANDPSGTLVDSRCSDNTRVC